MRKFTLFAAIVMALIGLSAKAQDLYVVGPFNAGNPTASQWALTQDDDDEMIYSGYVSIPAGQFSIHFKFQNFELVPSNDGEEAASGNVEVFKDSNKFNGFFAPSGIANSNWVMPNWAGGEVGIMVNFETNEVAMQYDQEVADVWQIRGAFNGYNPAGNPKWAMNALDGEDNGVYSATIFIPEGEFSFNLLNPEGLIFMPLSPTDCVGETQVVDFTDNKFTGIFDMAYDETEESCYWIYPDWRGGDVTVTINLDEATITIEADETLPPVDETMPVYIAGPFNTYNPDSNPEWELVQDEDAENIYRGFFYIPAGEFSFNFSFGLGSLVPGVATEGEVEASEANVAVEDSFFSGLFAQTGMSQIYWVNENWEGGEVEIVLDFDSQEIVITYDTPVEEIWYVSGQFNNYNPAGNPDWALTPLEDDDMVFTGTFTVPEGEFSFNLLSPYGSLFVPINSDYLGETVEVEFTDNSFTGMTSMAYDETEESCYWTYPEWEGGDITLTLDLNESTLTIVRSKTTGVTSVVENGGEQVIYNLNGMRVAPGKADKGIYIISGRKTVVTGK